MKELLELIEVLNNELDKKEQELQARVDCDINLWSQLDNRRFDVENFANSINLVELDPFSKNKVIMNYKKDAQQIIKEIKQIK